MEIFRLIVGVCYDYYSDFEGSFNLRVSLSWEFVFDYYLIVMYGFVFRVFIFGELYNINNLLIVGNLDFYLEEIDIFELGLNIDISCCFQVRGIFFYNNIQDIIVFRVLQGVVNFLDNVGELEVLGVELEVKFCLCNGFILGFNYIYQDFINVFNDIWVLEVFL